MQGIEKALAPQIRENKLILWIDKNELYPTEKFDSTIVNQIREADMVLLLLSVDFWASEYIQTKEFPLIMQEYRDRGLLVFPIILEDISDFTRYKSLEGIFAYPFNDKGELSTITDFEIKNRVYNKIAMRIEEISHRLFKNPYKHLFSFEKEDSANFYGRERVAKELANTTLNLKAGLLFGESGVGKTSLILAGVLVELNKDDSFQVVYIRCRADIVKNLKEILAKELACELLSIKEMLETYIATSGRKVLLIFDQFEEIFITVSKYEQNIFFKKILFEIKELVGVHLLFSLRADYLWRLNPYRDDFGELWNRSVGLERLDKTNALKAIIQPLGGDRIDDSLACTIYEDLLNIDENQTEQIHTPFLQLVMFELYIKAIGRNSHKLTQKLYNELGGANGIITNYFDGLLKKFNVDEHKSLEKLFFYLVTDSSTRDSLKKNNLEEIFSSKYERVEIYRLIDILIRDRVIRHITDIDEYYELVHDILALHISKRFNLRQNIKHLTNRLEYLEVEETSHRYLSEKELYEIIIYKKLFSLQEKHNIQIIRNIIKYQVKVKEWLEEYQNIFYQILFEFLEHEDNRLFSLALQFMIEYRELIDNELKEKVYTIIIHKFESLNNNDSQTYWILTVLLELEIEPSSQELAIIQTLACDFNTNWDITQKAVLLMLKYDFENEAFIEMLESEILFDFLTLDKTKHLVEEVIITYIESMGVKDYLEYMLEKFDIYASDMFDEEDDDILIYQYVLMIVESLEEYMKRDFYLIKSSEFTEKIETKLTELYVILASKIVESREYEKLFDRLENILLGRLFEFDNIVLIQAFINQAHPPHLNKKVAFNLSPTIPKDALIRIIDRVGEDDDILRQNAYSLLQYRFDEVLEIDLDRNKNRDYDEINLFLNFNNDDNIFKELTLSNKDIQVKRLEKYFEASIAYEQFVVWENYIDTGLQQLNKSVDKSIKNIMVGSFEMKDRDFREIKSSLDSFLSFFNIELMIDKLLRNFERLENSTLNIYKNRIQVEIKEYHNNQLENQKQDNNALIKVIDRYKELEIEIEKLNELDFLTDIRADIKLMYSYIEAKNIDILLDYWLGYITDVIFLLVKENDKESLELKEKLLQKMIKLNMYDNLKMLFKDRVSRSNKLDTTLLENTQDWHIQDTLLESYYELKTNIPLYLIDRFLLNSQIRIRQFSFKLLILNTKIGKDIKKERAFQYLDNTSLRLFALELLSKVGIKKDILKLIEYRSIQDVGFQEKLSESLEGIMGRGV
jgi:hypothetical protein